jgi:hypothetical protein
MDRGRMEIMSIFWEAQQKKAQMIRWENGGGALEESITKIITFYDKWYVTG